MSMKGFMDKDFLLDSSVARELYHKYAASCPIVDCHNHLSPKDIATGRKFKNLTQLWLEGDHYKWRAMRAQGIEERYITGSASDLDKFQTWAQVLPKLVGSPLYHWTHLELQRYFGIHEPLTPSSAAAIWEKTEGALSQPGYDAYGLLQRMRVLALCTTDDPADDLVWHKQLASCRIRVLPTFRPDRFLSVGAEGWRKALRQLSDSAGLEIACYAQLEEALARRLDCFCDLGCRMSDHGLPCLYLEAGNPEGAFQKALAGEKLGASEIGVFHSSLLGFLAGEYHKRDIAMQLHIGPLRNQSPRLFSIAGPDAGGDTIGRSADPSQLGRFLGSLEAQQGLPRTILYNLNPADNAVFSTMAATFAPKVQYGAAWWLNDHVRGITSQLRELMETGQLATSVGMLTDSRSFTSFVRHEYFRRILCNALGNLVVRGLYPMDTETLGSIVEAVCWKNCRDFLGIDVAP